MLNSGQMKACTCSPKIVKGVNLFVMLLLNVDVLVFSAPYVVFEL